MVDRDVVYGKITTIKRRLRRIYDATGGNPDALDTYDAKDIFVLNLQRAAQASIDIAAHVAATEGLGVPQDLKDNFTLLVKAGLHDGELSERMQKMVGFRNVAVHEYEDLNPEVLKSILKNNLKDFEEFYKPVGRRFRLDQV